MSRTSPAEYVNAEHWRYTAQAMDEFLGAVISQRAVRSGQFPVRLVVAAEEFLNNALSATGNKDEEDPSASIANYRIAARALRVSNPEFAQSRSKLEDALREHLASIKGLPTPRPLAPDDVSKLQTLKEFFRQVFQAADAQAYVEAVAFDPFETT